MFDRILFPTDGSDGAEIALGHVLDLAAAHDARLHLLNVAPTVYGSVLEIEGETVDLLQRRGRNLVDAAAARARGRGVRTTSEVRPGEPYAEIVGYANEHGVDLVAMPTHGRRGLERFLLGSVTERVLRRVDVPLLTLRPYGDDGRIEHPYREVVVPTDGSVCADDALETGIDVAAAEGAGLHVLSVVETAALGADVRSELQVDSLEERAERIVGDAAKSATAAGVDASTAIQFASSIPKAIRAYVDEHGIDLVVVGTHGRTGFDRHVLGSVSEALVRTSPVPVLTVRGKRPT